MVAILSAVNIVGAYQDYGQETNVNNLSNEVKVVRILIFSGEGTMEESVEGVKTCIDESNILNLTNGYYFEYDTTDKINSNTLSGYDILIMPGGNSLNYVKSRNINVDDIKQFISNGNGYLGICAGAYAASNSFGESYLGWGLASNVNTIIVNYNGLLSISTTPSGSALSNETTLNIYHQNGPAMYTTGSDVYSFAYYADNKTDYKDYLAIVGENYGSGRVLLTGSHPEMYPQNSQLLARMILWSTQKT